MGSIAPKAAAAANGRGTPRSKQHRTRAHCGLSALAQMVDTADTKQLEDALADLKASPDEAKEEHLPVPSDKALQSADHVLRAIYRIWPRRFEVYPMPNGARGRLSTSS